MDLRSGYYHIGLSEQLKAKTAFFVPFGKYQFASTHLFSAINFNGSTGLHQFHNGLPR